MTIFAILMPQPQPDLAEEIKRVYPNDYLALNETQWLVSSKQTVVEVSHAIGISAPIPTLLGMFPKGWR